MLEQPPSDEELIRHFPEALYRNFDDICYMLVFTDGSIKWATSHVLAHGGWGLFIASECPQNSAGPYGAG